MKQNAMASIIDIFLQTTVCCKSYFIHQKNEPNSPPPRKPLLFRNMAICLHYASETEQNNLPFRYQILNFPPKIFSYISIHI